MENLAKKLKQVVIKLNCVGHYAALDISQVQNTRIVKQIHLLKMGHQHLVIN